MREQLTVLIPCKNEQQNIGPCIQSALPIADEILVADSGSTDRTLSIASSLPKCRIIRRPYVDSGNFKNWAIPQARHRWVFVLDADERIEPALTREIQSLLQSLKYGEGDRNPPAGYWIYRNNYFMGHLVRGTSWGRDRVIRLFQRDLGRYLEYTDHTEVDLPTRKLGSLSGRLTHYTCWTYDEYFRKMHRYTEQQAELWRRQGRQPSLRRLICNGPLRFLRAWIIERGYRDGAVGFQVAALTGYYSFMKQARLWHKVHARSQADLEDIADCYADPRHESVPNSSLESAGSHL